MANIIPRGNGYFIMVSGGYDINGKQIRHTTTFKPDPNMTDRQAQKALNVFVVEFEARVKQGRSVDANMTFEDFSKRFMEQYAETQLAPKTISRYKELFKRINPAIGHLKLEKIQVQHLADLYAQLGEVKNQQGISFIATEDFYEAVNRQKLTRIAFAKKSRVAQNTLLQAMRGNPVAKETAAKMSTAAGITVKRAFASSRPEKVLTNKTIRHYHMLVSAVLNKAVEWEIIRDNKATHIKPPKVQKREIAFLEEEDVKTLIRALADAPIQEAAMIKLLLLTGMRRGELCGLEWQDIDFNKKILSIRRSSQYLPDKGVYTKDPKTNSSKRSMPLSTTTVEMLKKYKSWQDDQKLEFGDGWNVANRIFTTAAGLPIHPDTVTGWFRDFVERTGLPKVSVHGLRHTFITLLIAKGIDIVTVSNLAGHNMPSTTMNMYAHAVNERKACAVEAIGMAFDEMV
ncbi:MAG: tyrosine-type recombinase/integrase [Saccharofermentanales bacterium]